MSVGHTDTYTSLVVLVQNIPSLVLAKTYIVYGVIHSKLVFLCGPCIQAWYFSVWSTDLPSLVLSVWIQDIQACNFGLTRRTKLEMFVDQHTFLGMFNHNSLGVLNAVWSKTYQACSSVWSQEIPSLVYQADTHKLVSVDHTDIQAWYVLDQNIHKLGCICVIHKHTSLVYLCGPTCTKLGIVWIQCGIQDLVPQLVCVCVVHRQTYKLGNVLWSTVLTSLCLSV